MAHGWVEAIGGEKSPLEHALDEERGQSSAVRIGERKARERREPGNDDGELGALGRAPPSLLDLPSDGDERGPSVDATMFGDRSERRCRPDALGEESAADEGTMRRLHH